MAKIKIFNNSNSFTYDDLLNIDLDNLVPTTVNTTTIAGSGSGFSFVFNGSFSFNNSGLTGGTLQSIKISYLGSTLIKMTEISRDIVKIATSAPAAVEAYLMSGNDTVVSAYNLGDVINTYGGKDVITTGTGDDKINGGFGIDTFVVQDLVSKARITATKFGFDVRSDNGRDAIKNVELLRFDDVTTTISKGTGAKDVLSGDGQSAFLSDYILAQGGNDTVSGLLGNDFIFGHAGDDILSGNQGKDLLNGGIGADTLRGGGNTDELIGGGGADDLLGGAGIDILKGNGGRDRLNGQTGDDILTGGSKSDHFVFAKGMGHDTITDFAAGIDLIEIGRGAARMKDLTFTESGADVIVSFADVDITVQNITLAALQNSDNFVL